MNIVSVQRAAIFAQFEFTRFVFSKRGVVAIIGYLAIWTLILTKVIAKGAAFFQNPQFKGFISAVMGEVGLSNLSSWAVPELVVFWIVSVLTFPFFAMFSSADQLCGDKARGSIRFLLLRANRSELLIGRFLGQMCVVLTFVLLALIATNILVAVNNPSVITESFSKSTRIIIDLCFVVLPMIGFMTLLNTYLTSSKQAIVHCLLFLTLGSLLIGLLSDYVWLGFGYLAYFLPTAVLFDSLSLSASVAVQYITPFLQTSIYLLAAFFVFKNKAV